MGILVMPPFNGVSDGAIPVVLLSIYTGFVGNNYWATPIFDGAWMGIEGVEMITLGQFTALAISVAMNLLAVYTIVKILLAKWYPGPYQNEKVEVKPLLIQYSSYYVWTAVWLYFSYQGRDPIRISNPTEVNNETAAMMQDQYDYGQAYHTVHYLLYMFVIVYQSLTIMVN